jgi:hypothetical protein
MLRGVAANVNPELTLAQNMPKGARTRVITLRLGQPQRHDEGSTLSVIQS